MTSHYSECADELREIAVLLARAVFHTKTAYGAVKLNDARDKCYEIARFFETLDRAGLPQEPRTMTTNNTDDSLGVLLKMNENLEKILGILGPEPKRDANGQRFYAERDKFCSHCGKPRMQYLGSGCPVGGCPVGEDH